MNSSGNYKRPISAQELLGDPDPAPKGSNDALRNVLKMMGGKRG